MTETDAGRPVSHAVRLGLALSPLVRTPSRATSSASIEIVRRSLDRGFGVLDAGVGPTALPAVALVTASTPDGLPGRTILAYDSDALPLDAGEESVAGLPPSPQRIRWRTAPARPGPSHRSAVDSASTGGRVGAYFGLRVPTAEELRRAFDDGATVAAFPFHLLNGTSADPAIEIVSEYGGSVVALDPFAGGRLNGRRYGLKQGTAVDRSGAPVDWEFARAEMQRIVALGYLTAGTGRTLAAAALSFVLTPPVVEAAIVEVSTVGDLEEWVASLEAPPLGADEIARVLAGSDGTASSERGGAARLK